MKKSQLKLRKTLLMFSNKKAPIRRFFIALLFSSVVNAGNLPKQNAIASAHPLATQAGLDILEKGGNAFDAAVTVSAVLAVVEPYSSGFGGGGFWLLHRASDNKQVMIDGREKAPLAAHRDMYLDENKKVIKGLSINGALAAGIPGQAAALVHLSNNYGCLSLSDTLAPAIKIAKEGFLVYEKYQRFAGFRLDALNNQPETWSPFLNKGEVPSDGDKIVQLDLAHTLEKIVSEGHDGFYKGEVAKKLVDGVVAAGGIWSLDDLRQYKIIEREPVQGDYKDWTITSAALPSSGGIVLMQILNMLEETKYTNEKNAADYHYLIEAMRRAYRDRAEYMGDSDFVNVPMKNLLSKTYAKQLANNIQDNKASKSADLKTSSCIKPCQEDDSVSTNEGNDTTHFSIIDKEGNRVSATLSINYIFGSGFVPSGTGVLLNDEMDDFSMKPGVPNVYGLVGSEANAIEPGKRMLSSMTPTFIENKESVAILGTPGGSRIITMVLLGLLEAIENKPVDAWVNEPRFHHQYLPDLVSMETDAIDIDIVEALEAMGHQFKKNGDSYGDMQAVYWNKKTGDVSAASDQRGLGKAAVK